VQEDDRFPFSIASLFSVVEHHPRRELGRGELQIVRLVSRILSFPRPILRGGQSLLRASMMPAGEAKRFYRRLFSQLPTRLVFWETSLCLGPIGVGVYRVRTDHEVYIGSRQRGGRWSC
jgi:hypothetical protein